MTDPGMLQRNALAASATRGALANALAAEPHQGSSVGRYCAGCARICEGALPAHLPIADVMRYLMYARSYGDMGRARRSFAAISPEKRAALATGKGFAIAEARCPQRLPIGRLMAQAARELG